MGRPARAPRVVVASDSFKGSLTSLEVGDAVRLGLLDVAPHAEVVVVPVADGGEGTVAAALAAGWHAVPVAVHGPTGLSVTATVAVRDGREDLAPIPVAEQGLIPIVALVEMADVCGLGRLPDAVPAPLTASSRGLGEAIHAALDLGAAEVIVGVGGSASTDGGAGMLAVLGARLLDASGVDLPDGGAALTRLTHLDLSGLDPRLAHTSIALAADVDSPLLGPTGAAAVFAPQKGATPAEVDLLEAALTHWADTVESRPDVPISTNRSLQGQEGGVPRVTYWSMGGRMPGAGAAGGVGFALMAVLGAHRRSGIDLVLDLVGLDAALTGADLVITGEGSLDAQTLTGKAVRGVATRATAHGIPVVAVCGRLALDDADLTTLGLSAAYPLSDLEPDPERSMADAARLLRHTGKRIARDWLSHPPG
ncbi:MAG TPA: glycerate kinase [Ornithinibacter sp.]|uniref:glycerate kinase n=1 Tax=Ornithinibacter sp. TaxID=2862748 RepID=UPI002C6FFDE0|nr:glycerate kinase [Ornithinibacter sp.]MBU9943429.1 glycerate kinase [Dermatophilaceae bacterium]HQV83522.1 glycerate kinase [Ornithinibacter sp.]HQZ09765.1 glycerate kinase [Ornithinibacter sp.]HRA26552.1 glycerate kinase [Ornithinibacter sp.]